MAAWSDSQVVAWPSWDSSASTRGLTQQGPKQHEGSDLFPHPRARHWHREAEQARMLTPQPGKGHPTVPHVCCQHMELPPTPLGAPGPAWP